MTKEQRKIMIELGKKLDSQLKNCQDEEQRAVLEVAKFGLLLEESKRIFQDSIRLESITLPINCEKTGEKIMGIVRFTQDVVGSDASFELLPKGVYTGYVSGHEWKATKDGSGHFLLLTVTVKHDGREVLQQDRLNLDNPSQKAFEIAARAYRSICTACNELQFYDELFLEDADADIYFAELQDRLYGIPMSIHIGIESDKGGVYADKNKIIRYAHAPKPLTGDVPF